MFTGASLVFFLSMHQRLSLKLHKLIYFNGTVNSLATSLLVVFVRTRSDILQQSLNFSIAAVGIYLY